MGWKNTLNEVLRNHYKMSAQGGKAVSYATQASRREVLEKGFSDLRKLSYKLENVKGFKERHIMALAKFWEEKKLSASTIQNRISIFRIFSEWIGKAGMIKASEVYVKNIENIKRHYVAQTDKTWSGKNISLEDKLNQIQALDRYVALQLELQRAFGLRMKEAALLKPHMADKQNYLAVNWGTKGGRPRCVQIQTDYQQDVLARAKSILTSQHSSMVPNNYTAKQWKDHYYYICRQVGIDRKHGITSHGLRHERLNEIYAEITGNSSPIKQTDSNISIDNDLDKIASQEIAETAGHSRASISSAYVGK